MAEEDTGRVVDGANEVDAVARPWRTSICDPPRHGHRVGCRSRSFRARRAGRRSSAAPRVRPKIAFMAWHTLSNVYYLIKSFRGSEDARFFDCMQVAAARAREARAIVTRNTEDLRASPIPAISPAKALDFINCGGARSSAAGLGGAVSVTLITSGRVGIAVGFGRRRKVRAPQGRMPGNPRAS